MKKLFILCVSAIVGSLTEFGLGKLLNVDEDKEVQTSEFIPILIPNENDTNGTEYSDEQES